MSNKEVDDSNANANAGDGELKISPSDAKFFATIFKHLPQKLDMDWEKFAGEMGLKDGNIAKVCLPRSLTTSLRFFFLVLLGNEHTALTLPSHLKVRLRQIRKKLGLVDAAGTGNTAATTTKSSPSKAAKPNNANNKVTKPRKARKPAKAKQPKNALEATADAIHHDDVAAGAEDGEDGEDGEV